MPRCERAVRSKRLLRSVHHRPTSSRRIVPFQYVIRTGKPSRMGRPYELALSRAPVDVVEAVFNDSLTMANSGNNGLDQSVWFSRNATKPWHPVGRPRARARARRCSNSQKALSQCLTPANEAGETPK